MIDDYRLFLNGYDDDDDVTPMTDLLVDMHHFSHQNGINITECLRTAKGHFREEIEDAGFGAEDL